MNILPSKRRGYLKNYRPKWSKRMRIYFSQVLLLCVVLTGCIAAAPEEAYESATLSPTRTKSVSPVEPSPPPVVTNTSIASVIPTLVTVATSSTTVLLTPSPAKILATPTPTPTVTQSTPSITANGFLIYSAIVDEVEQIFALRPGGTSHYITTGSLLYGQSISPDQTKIVIDTNDQSNPSRIAEKVLIFDLESEETSPLNLLAYSDVMYWSADGTSLIYVARYSEDIPDQLVLYDIASQTNKVLVEMGGILFTAGQAIDGQTVAFVGELDEQYDLFVVDSDTLERRQVTNNSDVETLVLWSPISPLLLVGSRPDNGHVFEVWPWGIHRLDIWDANDGNGQLLTDKFLTSESISWAPDGQEIVFSDQGLLCIKTVETMEEICPLVDIAPYNEYFSSFSEPPALSLDGDWLAFRADNGVCYMIYFLELATNRIVPGDIGCDISKSSPLAPIYWTSVDLPAYPK